MNRRVYLVLSTQGGCEGALSLSFCSLTLSASAAANALARLISDIFCSSNSVSLLISSALALAASSSNAFCRAYDGYTHPLKSSIRKSYEIIKRNRIEIRIEIQRKFFSVVFHRLHEILASSMQPLSS